MRRPRGASELWILGRDLDRVRQAVQRASEYRGHESVLRRQRGDRLERTARTPAMRQGWIAEKGVELDQGHRRDRVFGKRFDPLAEAPQLVSAGAVEVTAQLRVAIPFFYVVGEVRRDTHPVVAEAVLVRANRSEQRPHLVSELTAAAFGMGHAVPSPVRALE